MSSRRPGWYLLLTLATGVALFMLAARRVDWAAVGVAVRGVSLPWLLLGVVGFGLTHLALARRWCVLVNQGGSISTSDAFDFLMIGNFAGLLLPARLADVARAVATGRLHDISASLLMGTIIIERLLDVVMLLAFGLGVSLLMQVPPVVSASLLTLLGVTIVASVVLYLGGGGPLGLVTRLIRRLRGPLSRGEPMFARFLDGISVVRVRARVPQALAMAALGWCLSAFTAWCNIRAFALDLPWYAGAFVVVVINLGGVIPSPPAGVGVYHYLATLALSPWVGDSSTAFAFSIVSHASSVFAALLYGAVSMARKGLTLAALRRSADAGEGAGA